MVTSSPAGLSRAAQRFQDSLSDHPPRRAVDRRASHRLVQSGPGHAPYAFSAIYTYARDAGARDFGADQRAVRDIRVVSAVFPHRAGNSLPVLKVDVLDIQNQIQSFGGL